MKTLIPTMLQEHLHTVGKIYADPILLLGRPKIIMTGDLTNLYLLVGSKENRLSNALGTSC